MSIVRNGWDHSLCCMDRFYLAGCCGSVAAALGSSLASSEGMGTAAGVGTGTGAGAGAEAGVVAGTAVDVEPESCTGGLGASEAGGEAAAAGLAFCRFKKKVLLDSKLHSGTFKPTNLTADNTLVTIEADIMCMIIRPHLGHHHNDKVLLVDFVVFNRCVILQDFSSVYQLLPGYGKVVFPSFCFYLLFQGLHLI